LRNGTIFDYDGRVGSFNDYSFHNSSLLQVVDDEEWSERGADSSMSHVRQRLQLVVRPFGCHPPQVPPDLRAMADQFDLNLFAITYLIAEKTNPTSGRIVAARPRYLLRAVSVALA